LHVREITITRAKRPIERKKARPAGRDEVGMPFMWCRTRILF
jgi:hypothetical protein